MKINRVEELKRKIAKIPVKTKEELRKALSVSAGEMVNVAQRFVPVDTGKLKNSIKWRYGNEARIKHSQAFGAGGDNELSVVVTAGNDGARHAALVEFGTEAHTIVARRKKVLASSSEVFGKVVHHPGATASPYFYPAYRLTKKRAKTRMTRAMKKAIRESVS